MKNKKFIFYTLRDEISKISWIFGPGRHAMSVGPKYDDLGEKWATIVTNETSQRLQACDDSSNTFLVLGPIDLTNGRAVVAWLLPSTLRGTIRYRK
jgi:hypothetical protein